MVISHVSLVIINDAVYNIRLWYSRNTCQKDTFSDKKIETEKYTISLIFKLSDIPYFVQQEQKQNDKINVWNLDRNEILNSHYTSQIGCSGDRSPSRCRCRRSCRESPQPKSFHLKTQAATQDNKICLLHELIFFWFLYCLLAMVSYKKCAKIVLDEPDIFGSTVNKVEGRILEGFRHQD